MDLTVNHEEQRLKSVCTVKRLPVLGQVTKYGMFLNTHSCIVCVCGGVRVCHSMYVKGTTTSGDGSLCPPY